MQVNNTYATHQANHQQHVSASNNGAKPASQAQATLNAQDTVTLSPQAMAMSRKDNATLPGTLPSLPNNGDKVEGYVDFKKAQMQYQVASDLAGVATGNGNGISAPTAYYLNNNDEARSAVVNQQAQQQNVAAMQAYAAASDNAQQWYEE
ncbi:hypothetical protein [Shewanella waksmanii]|uniref:hypothetical protein n=1 Tax=Shewanella waksmanii TaxID=213783 RepID=UPI00373624C4